MNEEKENQTPKEEPKHANKTKKPKNKKKIIIISSVIAAVVLIAIVLTILLMPHKETKKTESKIKEKWGQIYYEYLKDVNEKNKEKAGLPEDMKDAEIHFYDIENIKNPIMTIDYELNDEDYTNIYYINNKKVDVIVYNEPTDIELLYNIENKDYNYYTKSEKESENTYKIINKQITNKLNDETEEITEYTFKDDDKDSVTDVNGNEISLTKFEQTFIEIETENEGIKYNTNLNDKELKKAVTKTIDNYQEIADIVTEDIKKSTSTKEEAIVKKQEEMKTAKEEVEKKQQEEKAKKEAEEKAKQEAEKKANESLKVGSYTLKYGTYKGQYADEGNTLVLKQNGQCTYNGKSCTYTIGSHDFAQDASTQGSYKTCLVIKTSGESYNQYLMPYSNTEIGDGDIGSFVYSN